MEKDASSSNRFLLRKNKTELFKMERILAHLSPCFFFFFLLRQPLWKKAVRVSGFITDMTVSEPLHYAADLFNKLETRMVNLIFYPSSCFKITKKKQKMNENT